MPKNFVWYKGLSQLYVDETQQEKGNNMELIEKLCSNAEKEKQAQEKARLTRSDYNLRRCGVRSLHIMSQKSQRINSRGLNISNIDPNALSQTEAWGAQSHYN